jgi:hypothetical protein
MEMTGKEITILFCLTSSFFPFSPFSISPSYTELHSAKGLRTLEAGKRWPGFQGGKTVVFWRVSEYGSDYETTVGRYSPPGTVLVVA